MTGKEKHNSIIHIAVAAVFVMFAVSAALIVLTGAGLYENISENGQTASNERIAKGYISTKIRQAENAACVEAGSFNNENALFVYSDYDGVRYVTRIYVYDGWLRELFTRADDNNFDIQAGEKITEAAAFDASKNEDMIYVSITCTDGKAYDMAFALKGE